MMALALVLWSCDSNEETDDGFISNYGNTTMSGVVYDLNHFPVPNAKVTAHGKTTFTDNNGIFVFERISIPRSICFVNVEKDNYFSVMRSAKPILNGTTLLDAHIIHHSDGQTTAFNAQSNYTANLADGSSLEFSSSTEFVDENGNPFTGLVYLHTYTMDATAQGYSRVSPAGTQEGYNGSDIEYLDAYTGMMVELSDASGRPLALKTNTTPVQMIQEIPAALVGGAPNTAPLYYASNNNGRNNREGGAVKSGSTYQGQLGHFSFWSVQTASTGNGTLKCRVVDASGRTLSGVRVQVGQAYGITGQNGEFNLDVPAGKAMDVAIRSLDFYGFSVSTFQSAWSAGETRFVELQLPQNIDFATGKIVDCNQMGLAGQVTITWNGQISTQYSSDGNFNLPLLYTGYAYSLNFKNSTTDTTFQISTNSGITNLGHISLCQNSVSEMFVRIDSAGVTINTYNSFEMSSSGQLYINSSTMQPMYTSINAYGSGGNFQTTVAGDYAGTYNIGSRSEHNSFIFSTPSPQYIEYSITNGQIEITEYGAIGEFIQGVVQGETSNGYFVYCEFKVRRSADYSMAN